MDNKGCTAFPKQNVLYCFSSVQNVNSSKILISMMAAFLVCWTPYVLVLLLDHDNTLPMEAHLFATLLAHAHSSTPCIIYLCFKRYYIFWLTLFDLSRLSAKRLACLHGIEGPYRRQWCCIHRTYSFVVNHMYVYFLTFTYQSMH